MATAAQNNASPNPEENLDPAVEIDPSAQEDPQGDEPVEGNEPPARAARDEYTDREKTLMNKARADEKQKLHKELKERKALKEQAEDLQRQLDKLRGQAQSASPIPAGNGDAPNNDDLRGLLHSLQTEIREAREDNRKFRQETTLRDYKANKIAEVRADNSDVVESMLNQAFESEEDIDVAVDVARAEFEFLRDKHNFGGQPSGGSRTTQVIREARNRPSGVPRAPRNPSQVNTDDESISVAEIKNIIGGGAGVRSGAYAQNRPRILAAMARGKIRN